MIRRLRRLAAHALAAATVAGCGLAPPGASHADVSLLVTRDFGARTLASGHAAAPRGRETALDLLEAGAKVTTGPGGEVASVDGVAAAGANRWAYWVNGAQQTASPGSYVLDPGDAVQFDYGSAPKGTAIVGAYPHPFTLGPGGKRVPVHLECESDSSAACARVRDGLSAAGAIPAEAELGASAGAETVRIVVARWAAVRGLTTPRVLPYGPARSGVYARFDATGTKLQLFDASRRVARDAPAGSGLLAALAPTADAVTWLVTGVDQAGVERAAAALDPRRIAGAFAVAAEPAGLVRLPVGG